MQLQEITAKETEHIFKNVPVLYKYLDFNGGVKMIRNHNIKFADLATVNDPYDCYHGLIDYKMPNMTNEEYEKYQMEQKHKESLKHIGVASFSDSYKNLFLWGYYNYHQGICIGIDTHKLLDYIFETKKLISLIKVNYVEEIEKINFWEAAKEGSGINIFTDHLTRIKSTVWEKENEIRLVYEGLDLNPEKRITFPQFIPIPPECFVSIHLGCNLQDSDTFTSGELAAMLFGIAWRINPEIKIYEMWLNPNKFDMERIELPKKNLFELARKGVDKTLGELKGK